MVEPKVEPKIESNAMEVDSDEGQKGMFLISLKYIRVSSCNFSAESSKRKERAPPATCTCFRTFLLIRSELAVRSISQAP